MSNQQANRVVHQDVHWAVGDAVGRAVIGAVHWVVGRAMDGAVYDAVFWATVEDPDPVLGDFLLDLKPESDRAPRQMEAVSRGLGGRRTPNSEKSPPTRW